MITSLICNQRLWNSYHTCVHVTVTTTWVVHSNSPQPKQNFVSNVSNVTFHNIWGVQGAYTVYSAAGFMQWCQSCKFRATRTIPHLCTHWPLHMAVMVGTLSYITCTLPVILPHVFESADYRMAKSTVTGSKTSALYTKHSCVLRTVYYTHTIPSSSRRHWFSFCVSSPSRWDSKNLQGARDPVRTSESDHHSPSDRHLGVYRHRKPKAHCFLEQAR